MSAAFALSLDTIIVADALQASIAMLQKDMADVLTSHAGENSIVLKGDASLARESYRMDVGETEIIIHYADGLGAAYALMQLSERCLGVPPLAFWNETVLETKASVSIPCGVYYSAAPAVRYRGWFVNDEVLLDGWPDTPEDERTMWRRIFETILRLKGNMVIAGTDRGGEELSEMAADMGLILTHHHTELLGARMFARVYPEIEPSYRKHPELFEGLWREAVEKMRDREVVWAIGFRGQGDMAFWEREAGFDTDAKRGEYIVNVMRRQMEIVREVLPDAVFCTNLYGEMMGLYQNGFLPIPDEVIKIWADNGYGKMVSRRQGNMNPRVPSMPLRSEKGLNGLYYHASFYDLQAANHITMTQNPPSFIADELTEAVRHGATAYWLINVGSIKPHMYILDLIARLWTDGAADVAAHAAHYAETYYGDARVAELLTGFSSHALQYGVNADDKAGDQYYHFPLRSFLRRLMMGDAQAGVRDLIWAEGERPYFEQLEGIGTKCANAITGWQDYLDACENLDLHAAGKQLLRDTLILQATLHLTGCQALRDVYYAVRALKAQEAVKAYLYINRALNAHRRGLGAMLAAEHGAFQHMYRNDCFTNVRFSIRMLEAARAWLRTVYDGDMQYDWELQYLLPVSRTLVRVLTHRTNQLDDEALAAALHEVIEL